MTAEHKIAFPAEIGFFELSGNTSGEAFLHGLQIALAAISGGNTGVCFFEKLGFAGGGFFGLNPKLVLEYF